MSAAWQVVADCHACRTEASVTEVHAARVGIVARTCAACGTTAEHDGDRLVEVLGADMRDPEAAREALTRWAERENTALDELVASTMGRSVDEVLASYAAGEAVSTNLDVLAFLFPGATAGAAPDGVSIAEPEAVPVRPPPEEVPDDPRAPARVLATVMLADGSLRADEKAFVADFLAERQISPLQPDELRPWRPHELGPVRDTELARATLKAAVELMHLDGVRDGSELRIVQTFARVWGVDASEVDAWDRTFDHHYAPPLRMVWRALSRWVR